MLNRKISIKLVINPNSISTVTTSDICSEYERFLRDKKGS